MIAQSAIQANVAIGIMTKKQSRKEFDMPNIIKNTGFKNTPIRLLCQAFRGSAFEIL